MIRAQNGLIVDNNSNTVTGLSQLSDANGTQLVFTKTVGTVGKVAEKDYYTATGTNTSGYSWTYTAEALLDNPTKLVINVTKTKTAL